MSLLRLDNIGKIYVSEKNVTVGIRGVDLSFNRGEFVCVTGKSGSGKSTLLNVISGMDSYEEGELYIDGHPTSHYLQPDWEEYREKYISFIFQDYNIIDSFTVLENVELALMHIEDSKERRRRALELIDRVGLSSHLKHRGSKLSGGQKQRTVIARALAKDSPIILADEPTGNLDSETSKEIIDLLHRVSEDKLVIVVTHNFDDFAHCATRHIRIHDGSVEFDHEIKQAGKVCHPTEEKKKKDSLRTVKNGLYLGLSIFRSKPRLTSFLCLLMMIGTLGIFALTGWLGNSLDAFKPNYMFNHIDGRLVVTTQSGEVLENAKISEIATKYGAESYLRYDSLLDLGYGATVVVPSEASPYGSKTFTPTVVFGREYGDDIIGRYPENKNECFLYLPISLSPEFGKDELKLDQINLFNLPLTVTGVKYYYDNNLDPQCLMTEDGFTLATAAYYLWGSNTTISVSVSDEYGGKLSEQIGLYEMLCSFDLPDDKVYVKSARYDSIMASGIKVDTNIHLVATYYRYDNYSYENSQQLIFTKAFDSGAVTTDEPTYAQSMYGGDALVVSDEILLDIATQVLSQSYRQFSLFFENDKEAHSVAELLNKEGFVAVPSDTTYIDTAEDALFGVVEGITGCLVWLLGIVFLAFFINLCSFRAIEAFKPDMAIMRSMGISVRVIRIGVYVRMALCLIPGFLLLALLATLIYTSPEANGLFNYLYFYQYALIALGMVILTLRITRKQIARLFSESVKKSLKGGDDK